MGFKERSGNGSQVHDLIQLKVRCVVNKGTKKDWFIFLSQDEIKGLIAYYNRAYIKQIQIICCKENRTRQEGRNACRPCGSLQNRLLYFSRQDTEILKWP